MAETPIQSFKVVCLRGGGGGGGGAARLDFSKVMFLGYKMYVLLWCNVAPCEPLIKNQEHDNLYKFLPYDRVRIYTLKSPFYSLISLSMFFYLLFITKRSSF